MKNRLMILTVLLSAFLLLSSCAAKQLSRNYQQVHKTYSSKSKDEVWKKIIEFMAINGVSPQVLDKESGLIVSQDMDFVSNYTFEDGDGGLENPKAWIVVEDYSYDSMLLPYQLESITGIWNIRVAEEAGKTLINVNLVRLTGNWYGTAGANRNQRVRVNAQSLGNFEKMIMNYVQ